MPSEYLTIAVHAPGEHEAARAVELLQEDGYRVYRTWRRDAPETGDSDG